MLLASLYKPSGLQCTKTQSQVGHDSGNKKSPSQDTKPTKAGCLKINLRHQISHAEIRHDMT